MAELTHPGSAPNSGVWSSEQTIAQYKAVAWLRWRMFVNISRRTDSPIEIAGRVVLYVFMAGFAVSLAAGSYAASWYFTSQGQLGRLWIVFWLIFGLCQFLNINLGQPGTSFDPTQLIRFPLRVPTYVTVRLFFNLLSPANIMAMVMSLAAATGIIFARPRLWFWALLACLVFGLTNVLFSRMVFAWVDRWLSTRRAREVFTVMIFVLSLGFQYINLTFNTGLGGSHRHRREVTQQRMAAAANAYHRAKPLLRFLPPNLTSASLEAAAGGDYESSLAGVSACAAYGALFLLVFALRMKTEFHGESLSDNAAVSTLPAVRPRAPATALTTEIDFIPEPQTGLFPGSLTALLKKEWIYLRRNTGLIYGLIAPLFLVILFAFRLGHNSRSPWLLPIAIAYSLIGVAPMSYNSFGLDGTGAQIYFMSPVPLHRVFVAKNLMHFATAALEVVVVIAVMAYITGSPSPVTLVSVVLWAAGCLLLNTSLGNRRSIAAPKKINLARTAGRQASQASALLSLAIFIGCVGYGAAILALGAYLSMPWLSLPCFAALAAAGYLVYRKSLSSLQDYTLAHRDSLFEELGKS